MGNSKMISTTFTSDELVLLAEGLNEVMKLKLARFGRINTPEQGYEKVNKEINKAHAILLAESADIDKEFDPKENIAFVDRSQYSSKLRKYIQALSEIEKRESVYLGSSLLKADNDLIELSACLNQLKEWANLRDKLLAYGQKV